MEQSLVHEAKQGSRKALEALATAHIPRIYRLAYRMVGNDEDARDITQDVFIRAGRGLARFDESRPLYPWLHQITKNLCFDFLKRRSRTDMTLQDPVPSPLGGPEEEAVRAGEVEALRAALKNLSADHRRIIELKHFDECSYQEIAEVLGIPIGTVMSRLYAARQKLRANLEGNDND